MLGQVGERPGAEALVGDGGSGGQGLSDDDRLLIRVHIQVDSDQSIEAVAGFVEAAGVIKPAPG